MRDSWDNPIGGYQGIQNGYDDDDDDENKDFRGHPYGLTIIVV